MKTLTFRSRAIAAVTLNSITLATIVSSVAWAAEREEPAPASAAANGASRSATPTARAKDEVSTPSATSSPDKANVKLDTSLTPAGSLTKEKLSKQELQKASAAGSDEVSGSKTEARQDDQVTQALPTGGDKGGATSQSISTPKGEGKIQGMGESFSAQLSTGVASFNVPFELPRARGKAQATLGLDYSSSSGAGLAGMGWSVGGPYIARQTDRGLPLYDDRADFHANQDRFVFNGGQELVPICLVDASAKCAGALPDEVMPRWAQGWQYFRPRVEGGFLRFFWSPDHRTWRLQDKNGNTLELGVPLDGGNDAAHANGLDTDPDHPDHIFRWHLARQYDSYCAGGVNCDASSAPRPLNVVVYKYFQDSGQAYLSDIYDTTPASPVANAWDTSNLALLAHHTHLRYELRPDPTETYHSGWLIRQALRLRGVDITSKPLAGAAETRRQVRRYYLEYDSNFHTSYLTSVQQEGRCAGSETDDLVPHESTGAVDSDNRNDDVAARSGGLLGTTSCERLPAMALGYSHTSGYNTSGGRTESSLPGYEAFDARLKQVGNSPARSIDDQNTDYFDINADGLPDILVTKPGDFDHNASHGVFFNGAQGIRDTFGDVTLLGVNGVLNADSGTISLSNANVSVLDGDGDGIVDFLHQPSKSNLAVYHPRLLAGKWTLDGTAIAMPKGESPEINLGADAEQTRVVDVNADGLVDLVVSGGKQLKTYFSLGRLPNGYMKFGTGAWETATTAKLSFSAQTQCLPFRDAGVQFSDGEIFFGDMNADGLQDIVQVTPNGVRYWPGRGNGYWGTGPLDHCPADTFGVGREVDMGKLAELKTDMPVRIDDINGDGLDDLVQVRQFSIDIWLNVDGHGWTIRSILDRTPWDTDSLNRVRLTDINGSGTRDIVWGQSGSYQYMDLAGGEQPGLLVHVENGFGKSTDIEYSTSTEEMLAAERTGVPCGGDNGPFESGWCTKSPTVTRVVKRHIEGDNLAIAGVPASQYITEYSYRDPIYEGRQREFRGFRRGRSKHIGDENSPSDYTESTFLLGECEDETPNDDVDDCSLQERWRDNPREALKGLPVVTERYDEHGLYLSTEAITHRLRQLYLGRDGRNVRYAFVARRRTTTYDTAAPTSSSAFVAQDAANPAAGVQLELSAPSTLQGSTFSALSCNPSSFESTPSNVTLVAVPLRAITGYATVQSTSYVDAFGNQFVDVAQGCVDGSACPVKQTGNVTDESICTFTRATPLESWNFRADLTWTSGSADTTRRQVKLTTFDAFGMPIGTKATLQGAVPLYRYHASASRAVAPPPPTASVNSPTNDPSIDLGSISYDAFGNAIQQTGPGGRCRTVTYDDGAYSELPLTENLFSAGCGAGTTLTTIASYDRSLGLPTTTEDATHQQTHTTYDGLGRVIEVRKPRPDGAALTDALPPTIRISYDLPTPGSGRAYSIVHTESQDGLKVTDSEYRNSYAYVDGMGRTRVSLSEADPDVDHAPWIVSAITELDAKGAARRKYLPFFLSVDPAVFPVANARPGTEYGRQRYDAFGRALQTFDVDGTITMQSAYHALSVDLYDAADIYPGPHQGTYASTRSDGHGRTVATTERVHVGGSVELREVRTQYTSTGQASIITRVRVGKEATSPPVVRWMLYDTMGRMVVNAEPHATVSFNPDPASYTSTLKTWRYAYDDAGSLVGTSDARGCGANYTYDGLGRLLTEDYSPCANNHTLYSPPNFANTDGIEVLYQYDSAPPNLPRVVGLPPGYGSGAGQFSPSSPLLLGRLVAVHDRAASTWFKYDARGRVIETNKKIAKNLPKITIIGTRYRPRWYTQSVTFDAADRPVAETTGATQLLGSGGKSTVFTTYTKRGTVKKVGSSYGDLVTKIDRDAEGKVNELTFGDAARTTTHSTYDSRRRLRSVQTYRSSPQLWDANPAAYAPAPNLAGAPSTLQLTLEDLDYSYDAVGNPTEIRDWRDARDWPDGAKPVSRRAEYDDLNRLTRLDYTYSAGTDSWVSPFAAEAAGAIDPRRGTAPGQRVFTKRPLWQTYQYDWLGNTSFTDDDQHALYDRSLGTVTEYPGKPYQFKNASQAASAAGPAQVSNALSYDEAGNLTWVSTGRSTVPCTKPSDCVNLQYFYQWDEVGRLSYAGRPSNIGPFNNYVYDYSDERVIRDTVQLGGSTSSTLYIFDSLEVRGTQLVGDNTEEYVLTQDNEVPYLDAHGMRLGRVVKEPDSAAAAVFKGEPQLALAPDIAPSLHVFLELPDHLGSTSQVIDLATSELVESRRYQPFGATESDYRPDRWKGFREDYGFTGKEEDLEVGLQYFGKRYLNPYLGRWISTDPLALHQPGQADLNLYAYVRGAVLKAIDPLGLQEAPAGSAGGAGPGPNPNGGGTGQSNATPAAEAAKESAEAQAFIKSVVDTAVEKGQERVKLELSAPKAQHDDGFRRNLLPKSIPTPIGSFDVSTSLKGTITVGKKGADLRGSLSVTVALTSVPIPQLGGGRLRGEITVTVTNSVVEGASVTVKGSGMVRYGGALGEEGGVEFQATVDFGVSVSYKAVYGHQGGNLEAALFNRYRLQLGFSKTFAFRNDETISVPFASYHMEGNLANALHLVPHTGYNDEVGYGGPNCECSTNTPDNEH